MSAKSTFCTVANPRPGCTPVAGVAKPTTAATLLVFQNVQRNLNRVLYARRQPLLYVDGRIGPSTLAAMDVVRSTTELHLPQTTIDQVAEYADSINNGLDAVARSIGAPMVVGDPAPKSPPSLPAPGGGVTHPPDEAIKAAAQPSLSMTSPLVLAAMAVAVLLLLRGGKRGRRKR